MGTTLGIWNHGTAAASSLTKALPMSGTTGTSGAGNSGDSSSTASATISSNDFLTLLVTEMRNQDPTANTDPNEYINQLVNVNSLEQLIDINQTLTADAGSTTSATGSSSSPSGQGIGSSAAAITSSGVAAYPTPKSAALHLRPPHQAATPQTHFKEHGRLTATSLVPGISASLKLRIERTASRRL